ncbi:DNA-dependent protein kinase catalytic subunit-like [Petromyzon marinus]|uniref:DNA-dependent protein kinase catalytic subunit-like n=1 Tax=Petromyzon marinus TaxID=7757 RepID=UPI003F71A204
MSGTLTRLLGQLHASLDPRGDVSGATPSSVASELRAEVTGSRVADRALEFCSCIFDGQHGLPAFLRRAQGHDELKEVREEVLRGLREFLETVGSHAKDYTGAIKEICVLCYSKERAAKTKVCALELLIKAVHVGSVSSHGQNLGVQSLFNKFYGELASKSKVSDTVLERIYELLGVLSEVHPAEMVDQAGPLFRVYLGELKRQMCGAVRAPRLALVAGCLRGLTSLLVHFSQLAVEGLTIIGEIFNFTLKAIDPEAHLNRMPYLWVSLRVSV